MRKKRSQGFTLLEMTTFTGIKSTEEEHVIMLYLPVFYRHFTIYTDSQNRRRKRIFNTVNVFACLDLFGLNTLDPTFTDYQKRLLTRRINQA